MKSNVVPVNPLPRKDFIELIRGATIVVTDSGGVQEECVYIGRPCLTLRPSTERPITLAHGNKLTTLERLSDDICAAIPDISPLWDGNAAERIAGILKSRLGLA
jgi:UDP-N-acetylglucosamine 2-epimerase (non-hydrolysing)